MKTTFIATVLNEEESIEEFIDSLEGQSKKPNEIIIVDAGSKDQTRNILKKYKRVKVLTKKGNRSKGRNFAIKHAKGDIIIASDAGCILDKNFIKNITPPFINPKIDVVSGYYYPITNSVFEKSLATYTCVMPDRVDKDNFLPSSRSIAFRKEAWKKVNGYPEHLDTCEDLVFARNLKKNNLGFKFQKNAFVKWRQKSTFLNAWKQFYNYAKGDGKGLFIRPQTPLLFIRYIIGILLISYFLKTFNNTVLGIILCLICLYLIWSVVKNYKYVKNPKAFFYLPLLQIISDSAVITGMSLGIFNRFIKGKK